MRPPCEHLAVQVLLLCMVRARTSEGFCVQTSVRHASKGDAHQRRPFAATGGPTLTPEAVSLPSDPPFRIGHGFDIHRLEPGLPLVIGGVTIDFERGSAAHSDGDAMYHSVADAILGAIGMPDIGQLFPDKDPTWKGVDSAVIVSEAVRLMQGRGYKIANADVTLIMERPKVKDIKPRMKANLVSLLQTEQSRVNIKARTHEKVDSVGESRSWVVHAVVMLEQEI